MSLEQWFANGWLLRHTPDAGEIQALFDVANRDMAECASRVLGLDWRFSIAYNAALQLAVAALHASGYEVARGQSHHLRAIQSLAYTLGLEPTKLDRLDGFRLKRHAGVYEKAGTVSRAEADEMVSLAKDLRQLTLKWLDENHADLAPRTR